MNNPSGKGHRTHVADPASYSRHCTCGLSHPSIDTELYIGDDAAYRVSNDLKATFPGGSVLLLDDVNTHKAAGEAILSNFRQQGIGHTCLTLPGDISATSELAEQVYRQSGPHDLILAVGAGTINDLGKYAAARHNRGYWAFPTAPSMNGFTSSIAAIKVEGVKRTLPAPPPLRIYVCPPTIGQAPLKLMQSGYCDVLAKSVSDVDWQIESMLFSNSYCRLPSAIVAETEHTYLDQPDLLKRSDTATAMALLRGLLVSGAAMRVAGSSAPASGGEHLFSHVLDMRESITGRQPGLHGLQVAAGIIVSAACYARLAQLRRSELRPLAEKKYRRDAQMIPGVWGPLSAEVEKRFALKRVDLMALDTLMPQHWKSIQSLSASVRSPQHYAEKMRRTGFALTLEALHLDETEFILAATTARVIREKITVLDMAAQAGIMETAAEDALQLLR